MELAMIGAIVGGVLGAVVVAVIVTCIVYMTRRLKKRTNSRAKLITTQGTLNNKWVQESKHQRRPDDEGMYFGDLQETDHVKVKEKRHTDVTTVPARQMVVPPPNVPILIPRPLALDRSRKVYRSWGRERMPAICNGFEGRERTPPQYRRRHSFGEEERPNNNLMLIMPYQQQNNKTVYSTTIAPACETENVQPAPRPALPALPAPEPASQAKRIVEQDQVITFEESVMDLTNEQLAFAARNHVTNGGLAVASSGGGSIDYTVTSGGCRSGTSSVNNGIIGTKEMPRIVTDVMK